MAIDGEGFSKEIGGVKEGTDVGEDKHILGHAVAEPICQNLGTSSRPQYKQ